MSRQGNIRAERLLRLYREDRAKVSAQGGSLPEREVAKLPRLGAGGTASPSGPVGCDANGALQPTGDFVLARRTDPMSSHRAARAIVKSGARKRQADAVLEALRCYDGSTTRELAELAGLDRYMVGRRMPELAREGRVKRVEFFDGRDCRWYVVQPVVEIRNPLLSGDG